MMWFDDWDAGYQIEKNLYCSSPYHKLIGVLNAPGHPSLENIGKNGENLSIGILSMNRAELTMKLMSSIADVIPDFQGICLIVDNGSEKSELDKLYRFVHHVPYTCQIEELGKNYGTAAGRNRMMRLAKTDWVLSLDNDMEFTSNILPQAQEDIATLGVQFMMVPFVNNHDPKSVIMGGNLVMENIDGRVNAGVGTSLTRAEFKLDTPCPGYLCTCLLGGASIVNKHTFFQAGGFDEGIFVGFEDIEFSMRLFQAGYKVGSMGMVGMSHNHVESKKKADIEYEKVRFKYQILYDDAMHFEKKHGVGVWNRVAEQWLKDRQKTLNIADGEAREEEKKKKVALVIDAPDWAYDHIADQIIWYCSDEFDIVKYYTADIDNLANLFVAMEDCDVIHFFWRAVINWYYDSYAQDRMKVWGFTNPQFREKYISHKLITTSVYDHLYLKEGELEVTKKLFASPDSIVDAYSVSSLRLKNIYDRLPGLRLRPAAMTPDGVDLGRFKPVNLERLKDVGKRTIRFGWVENSNWKWADVDLKGVHTIIRPAIEELRKEGYDVELVTSDRNQKMIPHYLMPKFYEQVDCYVCASLHEGTPNPVLESMACGLPVISTDVGLIPELFGKKQKAFILKERTKEEMIRVMKQLIDHPEMFSELSEENLKSIQAWDWSVQARKYLSFWKEAMEKKRQTE